MNYERIEREIAEAEDWAKAESGGPFNDGDRVGAFAQSLRLLLDVARAADGLSLSGGDLQSGSRYYKANEAVDFAFRSALTALQEHCIAEESYASALQEIERIQARVDERDEVIKLLIGFAPIDMPRFIEMLEAWGIEAATEQEGDL